MSRRYSQRNCEDLSGGSHWYGTKKHGSQAEGSYETGGRKFRDDDVCHTSATKRPDTDVKNNGGVCKELLSIVTESDSHLTRLAKQGDR